ncbi:unnamed protein product [Schistosoma curassoni]|uniref:Uncharacterized protein n=1 Tax=Schistosoma curassoni TaxID=6186 RepID=A0A183JEH2_9TREM|nr:unnamed protein product [Schistosoma curassoni]
MVRCGLFGFYINPVCLKYMINIAEAEVVVLNSTSRSRQEEGSIRKIDCLCGFTRHWSLIGGIITSYINRAKGHKL